MMTETRTSWVLKFDSPDANLTTVGGKGANLALMTQASFPVPPGFFVTTTAYRRFVQANELKERILELANGREEGSQRKSAAIQELFARGEMPTEVAAAIHDAYVDLTQESGDLPLAVRSSATAEDLPGASFAGQQDTYLNVRGEPSLLDAVQRCWSSLWTARAVEYRARQGIDSSAVSLAVIVQAMVPAEVSGIMFTANPITGARDEIVLDAAWGLGEAIVGGLVTPDHVVVDKTTLRIKQMTVGDKAVMTLPTSAGTEERPVEEDRRRSPALTVAQAAELARIGLEIEEYYGAPQDIEWCLARGRLSIVQARPITTLPPEPVHWESPVPGAKWLKDQQAAEWATEPLSTLGATTTFATMIATRQHKFHMQRVPLSTLINGWLYVRADFRSPSVAIPLEFILRYMNCIHNGHRRVRRVWAGQIALLNSLEHVELPKLSKNEIRTQADRLLEALGWWWWELSLYAAAALFSEQLIRKLRVVRLGDPGVLFRGNDSLLLEGERALRLAATTGNVEPYLARFGHMVESADPIHPTLRESKSLLNQHLVMAHHGGISPDDRLSAMRRERAEAEGVVRAVRGPRGFVARVMLKAGQSHAAHVDDATFHFERVLASVRALLLEAGRRLVRKGALEREEDVFYLERDEVWAPPANLAERVERRRKLRERQKRLAPPPFVPPLSDPTWANDPMWRRFSTTLGETVLKRGLQEREGRRILVGTPGSPGRARGIARVISGPDDFHRFQTGDVLVAHTTTPVWTPLFNIASAAVTEVGGPFSHAAIVAREFGIPLVNGALDATRAIEDGMPVVVDGSAGLVEL